MTSSPSSTRAFGSTRDARGRSSRVSGLMIWYSSSTPMVKSSAVTGMADGSSAWDNLLVTQPLEARPDHGVFRVIPSRLNLLRDEVVELLGRRDVHEPSLGDQSGPGKTTT